MTLVRRDGYFRAVSLRIPSPRMTVAAITPITHTTRGELDWLDCGADVGLVVTVDGEVAVSGCGDAFA